MRENFKSTIPLSEQPYLLPENWTWFYWKDLMKSFQQGMIRSNSELGDGNVGYLKMGDLDNNGNANLNDLNYTDANEDEINTFKLKEGDFLINVRNSKDLVGKTCFIEGLENNKVLYNHMLVRVEHGSQDLNFFINEYLNTPSSKKLIERVKQGTTTVIALYQRDLNNIPIPLPDFSTFNSIVRLLKSINRKTKLNNRINAELEAMAKLVYEYWFVQFDFPFVTLSGVEGYKSSGGKMVWNEELKREIPEGWRSGTISDIASLTRGVTYNKDDIKDKSTSGTIPILRATNITGNQIDLSSMVYVSESLVDEEQILKPFDILITMSSGSIDHIGKNGFYLFKEKVAFGAFCAKIKALEDFEFYLYSYTQSDFFFTTIKNECLGTNINNLNGSMVKGFKMVIPDNSTLTKFNDHVKPFFEKIKINANQNQQLSSLRDWLLPMLMNGQVSITEAEERVEEELGMVAEREREEYKSHQS